MACGFLDAKRLAPAALLALVLTTACSKPADPKPAQFAASADGSTADAATSFADAAGDAAVPPNCIGQPSALWHALEPDRQLRLLAAEPSGALVAAGQAGDSGGSKPSQVGWRRYAAANGQLLGGWLSTTPATATAIAVSTDGAFVLAGFEPKSANGEPQRAWIAGFASDGTLAWTEVGQPASAWQAVVAVSDGFVFAGVADVSGKPQVQLERRTLSGGLVWGQKVSGVALASEYPVSLAVTATGTVLVGGTRTGTQPDADTRAVLHAVQPSGAIDAGSSLLGVRSKLQYLGPWLADGRLLMTLVPHTAYDLYHTRLYAWTPAQVADLGLEIKTYQGPCMSCIKSEISAVTALPGRAAWLEYSYCSGGTCSKHCGIQQSDFGSANLTAPATPSVIQLDVPPACKPLKAECPMGIAPHALVALPDGGFAIAGDVDNCGGAGPGAATGWVGRFAPLCGP